MAFSFASYTGDGSTEFAIPFNYLTETVVVGADPKGIEVHLDSIKQVSGYTIDTSLHKVNFTTGPTTGVDIKILRVTPRGKADRLVDWADATILTEAQLDTMALQLLYISQEAFEQSSSGGSVTPTYLSYNEAGGYWDATFNAVAQTVRNIADAGADDGLITKKYVDDVAVWGISGVPQSWTFTGNGTQDTFSLTAAPYVEAEMLVVAVDGILQVPTADFTVEGGAVNSTLDFLVAPGTSEDPVDISVQNFGKMRFLDGVDISDGSVTTVKLDQTLTTEAVTTATMRDDAVTAAKIADDVVDLARVDTTTFTTSTGDTTPRFLSVPVSGTGLTLGTLSAAQVSDFNSTVTATKLDAFAVPTGNVDLNSQAIVNLADPTAASHATPRDWVQNEIATTADIAGITKLGSFSLGAKASSFAITNWYDAVYDSYELECYNFCMDDSSGGAPITMEFADSGGTYRTSSGNVATAVVSEGTVTSGGDSMYASASRGYATPLTDDQSSEIYKHNFKVWLPNNRSGFGDNRMITSKGYGQVGSTGSAVSAYNCVSFFMYNTNVVTKIRFRASGVTGSTYRSLLSGARVIVYGRTF